MLPTTTATTPRGTLSGPFRLGDLTLPKIEAPVRALLFVGTLGSGKTTLLNELLNSYRRELGRYVVIENDLGENNIDYARIAAPSDQKVKLNSGCVCCSDLRSLEQAIDQLTKEKSPQATETFLIETTGIAAPAPIQEMLARRKLPACTIVTLHVPHLQANLESGFLDGHIGRADIVVLTHTTDETSELRGSNMTNACATFVRAQNPRARILIGDSSGQLHHLAEPADSPPLLTAPVAAPLPHQAHGYSVALKTEITVEELHRAFKPLQEIILRAKGTLGGTEIDVIRTDWILSPARDLTRGGGFLNIITREPLLAETLKSVISESSYLNLQKKTRLTSSLSNLETLLFGQQANIHDAQFEKILRAFPASCVNESGRVMVDYQADVGFNRMTDDRIAESLRFSYLQKALGLRMEAISILSVDEKKESIFTRQRLAGSLCWALLEYPELLQRAHHREAIERIKPATLFFKMGSITPPESPYVKFSEYYRTALPRYYALLEREVGDSEISSQLYKDFQTRLVQLEPEGNWRSFFNASNKT